MLKIYEGLKINELTEAQKDELRREISGVYYPDESKAKAEKAAVVNGYKENAVIEVTIDFENGLAVKGYEVVTENETIIEIDENAEVYNPTK